MIGKVFQNMFKNSHKGSQISNRNDSAYEEEKQPYFQTSQDEISYERHELSGKIYRNDVQTPIKMKKQKHHHHNMKNQNGDSFGRHQSCPDTQQLYGTQNAQSKYEEIKNCKENGFHKQQTLKHNSKSKHQDEFLLDHKMSKDEMKKRRKLQKDKKDVKIRREWGSQSGELLVIKDDYIPEPDITEQDRLQSQFGSSPSMIGGSQGRGVPNFIGSQRSQDLMRICSDTSSTSESDINSQDGKPTGYEKILKKLEKKKGKISKEDFSIISLIGTGSYGKVFLVRKHENKKIYAMKVLTKSFVRKYKQVKHTWTERKVLEKVNHPFIVKLKYAFQSPKKLFLVMEYCPGGELFFYLSKIGRFKERSAQFYAANILLALEFLHKKGVIYRDLKPENVLISADGYAKITDFGLSKDDMSEGKQTKSICGTTEYLSPEMLLGKGYDNSCDWWGFGCLLYEMLVGLPPFYCKSQDELFYSILHLPPSYPDFLNPDAINLISMLLDKDPYQRLMNPKLIKQHQFFRDIDWKKMKQKKIKPPYVPTLKCDDDTAHFDTNGVDLTINQPADALNETIERGNTNPAEDFNHNDFDGFTFEGNSTILYTGSLENKNL